MPLGAAGSTYAAATIPETMRTLGVGFHHAVDFSTSLLTSESTASIVSEG